ncbi:MAG: hypothetical protein K2M29_06265 [Paramuribaculum sp.]|nr:hypothetical protein [Paramuribaculum sp.]
MIIKKYAKCTLVAAAVLAANVSAFAQVKLNGIEKELSWADFAAAVNTPSKASTIVPETTELTTAKTAYNAALEAQTKAAADVDAKETAVADAQTAYDNGVNTLNNLVAKRDAIKPQTERKNYKWFTDNRSAFNTFEEVYTSESTAEQPEVWYYILQSTRGKNTLYISFLDPDGYKVGDKSLEPLSADEFYKQVVASEDKAKDFANIRVYLGTEGGPLTTSVTDKADVMDAIATAFATAATQEIYITEGPTDAYEKAQAAVDEQTTTNDGLLATLNSAKTDLTNAQKTLTTANNTVTSTKATLDAAQASYDQTVSAALNNVTLTQDITAASAVTAAYAGTINAGNHILTAPANGSLFTRFTGELSNAAVNGAFATNFSGAHFANVASWNNGNGAYYDEQNNRTAYTDIAEFGYAIRKNYGVDFNGSIVAATLNTVVYKLTVAEVNSTSTQYVQYNNGFSTPNGAYTLPVNRFAQSATTDIKDLKIANVYYGTNNDCASVVITDGQDFFCPVDVNAASITYNREFKKGMNSVCLPFAVETTDFTGVTALSTYDREADDKFWFNSEAGEVKANTPLLVICGENGGSLNMTKTGGVVKMTDASQIAKGATASNGSTSYGTFKRVSADGFNGAFNASTIYGLQGGEFHPAKVNGSNAATFPAFRMVVASATAATSAAPRYVGIVDEFGVDITENLLGSDNNNVAAIDGVEAGEAMSIVGGFGVITFTSAEDYGYVNVYSLDGKVAAAAEVVAGTTTVNVAKGLYIVEGQKVLVK